MQTTIESPHYRPALRRQLAVMVSLFSRSANRIEGRFVTGATFLRYQIPYFSGRF